MKDTKVKKSSAKKVSKSHLTSAKQMKADPRTADSHRILEKSAKRFEPALKGLAKR